MLDTNEIVKERDKAVVLAWTTSNYSKLYEYINKYCDLSYLISFRTTSDIVRKLTVAKMICNITNKEVVPYHNECKEWLKSVGSNDSIN